MNYLLCRMIAWAGGTPDANLFRTLGRQRGLFRGWLGFAARLMPGGVLSRRETELVIVRVAAVRACRYELEHHQRLAARAQVTPIELARVCAGELDTWPSVRERALLVAAGELLARRDLGDAAWSALRRHCDDRGVVELCLLVGHYDMLATTIAALRITPDRRSARRARSA